MNTLVILGKQRPVAELLKLISKLDRPATSSGSTRVFYLKHGDASKIAEILTSIIAEKAAPAEGAQETTIQAEESVNAIVVRADRGKHTEITDILKMLDVRRSQVLIEAAIVEVSITESSDLGVDLFAVDQSGSSTPLIISPLTGALQSLIAGAGGGDTGGSSATPSCSSPGLPSWPW